MAGHSGASDLFPLATDPRWQAVKDAFYKLLARRALGEPALPDRALVLGLARLEPPAEGERAVAAALLDLGSDLGRHLYAKGILEDSVADAVGELARRFSDGGLGTLTSEDAFHRTVTLRLAPSEEAALVPAALFRAHVLGVLAGAFGEAFKCRTEVADEGDGRYRVRLAEGRDAWRESP